MVIKLLFVLCLFLTSCTQEIKVDVEESEIQYLYYYEKLKEEEKEQYDLIYEALIQQDKSLILNNVNPKEVERLFSFVRNDHPSLFWVEHYYRYVSNTFTDAIQMKFNYNTKKEDRKKIQEEIDFTCDSLIASIDPHLSTINKVKYIYDYLIDTITYEENSLNNQNIISSLINKKSVCAGYAKAFQYLLLKMGIACTYLEGNIVSDENIRHAWNMVKLEDDYFYVDSTWGDQRGAFTHACSAYFSMNEEEMQKLYRPDAYYENGEQIYLSYFKDRNMYFDMWDEEKIILLWKEANINKRNYIEMKCDKKEYEDILLNIRYEDKMMPLLREAGIYVDSLFYVENRDLNMIEIFY